MFPQVFGKYILERELSRGGMARVLLATLRGAGGFEKRLVVKQIREELCSDQQFVSRFVEEAKTTVALSHPNIVPVYELGVEQGTYFLALELVDGVTVHELLKGGEDKKRRLTPEQGAYIGVEVCRALDYAHRRMQVVHRDITPRNVMLDEEGQVKVIDFGIAAPARVAGHEVFGSPGHMPPEQVDGHELGPATDIFAVAVLLMEAWSGAAPFRRATEAECEAAMRAPHPRPSDADPRLLPLDEVIGRALSLDPALRPKDADELGRALRKFMQGIDGADVARDLGAHVRSVRKALAKKRAKKDRPGYEWKPSQPSIVEFSTKTFAVREEVRDWKSESPPPVGATEGSSDGPSTRQMPTSGRPPPREVDEPETIATRPLETPVGPLHPRSAPPTPRSRALVAGVAAVAVIAATAIFAIRGTRAKDPGSQPIATTTTPTQTPTTSSTQTQTQTQTPIPIPTPTPSPTPTGTGLATGTPTPSASATASGKAHLALFGDPGTLVSVDGRTRGAVPVGDLTLDPGTHDVLFTFEATGERRGDRITLSPGEKVRLRADFTGAVPTIRVER